MFALNQLKREFNFEKEKNELVQEVRNQLNNKIIDRLKIEELLKTFEYIIDRSYLYLFTIYVIISFTFVIRGRNE